jgi:hypothetical protein
MSVQLGLDLLRHVNQKQVVFFLVHSIQTKVKCRFRVVGSVDRYQPILSHLLKSETKPLFEFLFFWENPNFKKQRKDVGREDD